tara:strand:- start:95 stop:244 length:150 start_codon:yes stop_codon:yes gene_type:complete
MVVDGCGWLWMVVDGREMLRIIENHRGPLDSIGRCTPAVILALQGKDVF